MAEASTLARPYARAVFDLAKAQGALADWSAHLAGLSAAVSSPEVAPWIGHPALPRAALAEVLLKAAKPSPPEAVANLVKLLAENGRLRLAPAIAEQYEALRAEAEQRVAVDVVSAAPLDEAQRTQLSQAIAKRLDRQVDVTWSVDEALIAGAVIRAGDLVIDGSFSAGLDQMHAALTG